MKAYRKYVLNTNQIFLLQNTIDDKYETFAIKHITKRYAGKQGE